MRKTLIIILIIFLPLYLLLKSVEINAFHEKFYLESYEEYNVTEVTGKGSIELENITGNLFKYLRGRSDEEVLKPFFNEREIKHLEDVQVLFRYGFTLKNLSFILATLAAIIIFIYKEGQRAVKGFFYGTFIWWGAILLLFLLSAVDFTKYFTYFHLIFFNNDLWLLDPNTDLLIQMLPEEFFINIFKRTVLLFMSMLATIQIISFILMREGRE